VKEADDLRALRSEIVAMLDRMTLAELKEARLALLRIRVESAERLLRRYEQEAEAGRATCAASSRP
jgi:hypothetical protein